MAIPVTKDYCKSFLSNIYVASAVQGSPLNLEADILDESNFGGCYVWSLMFPAAPWP